MSTSLFLVMVILAQAVRELAANDDTAEDGCKNICIFSLFNFIFVRLCYYNLRMFAANI